MKVSFSLIGVALLTLVAALPPGAASKTAAPEVLSPSEQSDLVESYNRWAAGLRSLRASGKARVGSDLDKTRVFDFSLVCARPHQARLQGRWGSLASLFDLSGDDAGWTLYLPRERSVVRAQHHDADVGLLLPPVEIISVLLPAGIPPKDLEREGAAVRDGEWARLVVPPGHGGAGSAYHRVLWIDPRDGRPHRLEIRRATQLERPILTATYEAYEGRGAKAFPVKVKVDMGDNGEWARFDFGTVRINTEVNDDVFRLRIPQGTRELAPEELTPDFLPEEEG